MRLSALGACIFGWCDGDWGDKNFKLSWTKMTEKLVDLRWISDLNSRLVFNLTATSVKDLSSQYCLCFIHHYWANNSHDRIAAWSLSSRVYNASVLVWIMSKNHPHGVIKKIFYDNPILTGGWLWNFHMLLEHNRDITDEAWFRIRIAGEWWEGSNTHRTRNHTP